MSVTTKKIFTYAGIIALFAIISFGFAPQLLGNKVIFQQDRIAWLEASKETKDYNAAHPDDKTRWSNSMFSGMPNATFYSNTDGNLLGYINPVLDKSRPGSYLFISLLGGFLLMSAFGFKKGLAVIGAIAITLCSYNIQIIQAGHNTKMLAIAYMPWVLAAIVYAYKARSFPMQLLGAALFGVTLSLQIQPNHPQITYYLAIIVLAYAITELILSIRKKTFRQFAMASALLLVLGICGIATVSNKLMPLMEYTEYSIRGGDGLEKEGEEEGLDLEYATAWSYGINEMPNLMIPNYNGGSSAGELGKNSDTYAVLSQNSAWNLDAAMKSLPLYWGPQPFTVGPMYLGAIIVMLALLGLIISKDRRKWWLLAVSLFAILLAWGSHIMGFTKIMYETLPFYNKFRTVSMALVILQITTPLLAVMGLAEFLKDRKKNLKSLYTAAGITAGIALLVCIFPGIAGNFTSAADMQYGEQLASALRADRISLLRNDALRTAALITIAAGIMLFVPEKKKNYSYVLMAALVIFDLWGIDKRYLNENHFIDKSDFEAQLRQRPVDAFILQDPEPYYRVIDLSSDIFNDSFASYYHKNIGGYSAAKLSSYQNIIDKYLVNEINGIYGVIGQCNTIEELQQRLPYSPVLSMLNCKYIILDGEMPPVTNPWAQGNAWFAGKTVHAGSAADALGMLDKIDLRNEAVITGGSGQETLQDSTSTAKGTIVLTGYSPKRLVYASDSQEGGLAVFSDIYYPAGWKAYIDGIETEIKCADYLLRAIDIPAGQHEIVFEFEPQSYIKGDRISLATSAIIILVLAGAIVAVIMGKRAQRPQN